MNAVDFHILALQEIGEKQSMQRWIMIYAGDYNCDNVNYAHDPHYDGDVS